MKILLVIVCFFKMNPHIMAQGHIDVIKNQQYLKSAWAKKIDCNNMEGDNLSARICANLAFQKADSLLVLIYNKLLSLSKKEQNFRQLKEITGMQKTWRKMRDEHCSIIYIKYEGGHTQAIAFLTCLTELTNSRTEELQKLYNDLSQY